MGLPVNYEEPRFQWPPTLQKDKEEVIQENFSIISQWPMVRLWKSKPTCKLQAELNYLDLPSLETLLERCSEVGRMLTA